MKELDIINEIDEWLKKDDHKDYPWFHVHDLCRMLDELRSGEAEGSGGPQNAGDWEFIKYVMLTTNTGQQLEITGGGSDGVGDFYITTKSKDGKKFKHIIMTTELG